MTEPDAQKHDVAGFQEVSCLALERLVARSPNLRTLRINRAVPLKKLPNLLRRNCQLVEFGTGDAADVLSDLFSNLTEAFSACKQLKCLSGFWDFVPAYLPAIYPVCSRLTSLNLSYATCQQHKTSKALVHQEVL